MAILSWGPGFHAATSAAGSGTFLAANGYDANSPDGHYLAAVTKSEIFTTAILVMVIFVTLSKGSPPGFAGIPIGLTVTGLILVTLTIDATSINPIRSLGPAVLLGGWSIEQVWAFKVFPIIGGVIGALVWKCVFMIKPEELGTPEVTKAEAQIRT